MSTMYPDSHAEATTVLSNLLSINKMLKDPDMSFKEVTEWVEKYDVSPWNKEL